MRVVRVCSRDEYFERACASGRVPPRKHGCLQQKKQNEGGRRSAACLVVFSPLRTVLSVQSRHYWLRFCTKAETSLSLTVYGFCRRILPVACTNVLRISTRGFEKFAPVGPPRSPNRERIRTLSEQHSEHFNEVYIILTRKRKRNTTQYFLPLESEGRRQETDAFLAMAEDKCAFKQDPKASWHIPTQQRSLHTT